MSPIFPSLRRTGIPSGVGELRDRHPAHHNRAFHVGGIMPGVSFYSVNFYLKILFFRSIHVDTCEKQVILLLSFFPSASVDSPASSTRPHPPPRVPTPMPTRTRFALGGDGSLHCFFTHEDDTTSIFRVISSRDVSFCCHELPCSISLVAIDLYLNVTCGHYRLE